MLAPTLFTLAGLVSLSAAGYVIQDDYSPASFFSMFDFFTDSDPTHGYVQYVDQGTAQSGNLINTNNNAVYIGVDHTNVASGSGRQSVRLTSSKTYNHGLIILDVAHMPGGTCGTWPAFWMVGPNWPNNGEIDIIEGVNSQSSNDMTLHTGSGCSISSGNAKFAGAITTSNCDVAASGQAQNAGCQIASGDSSTYGTTFNANQGGVYATEWTSSAINIYFFPRGSIPADITSGNPDPTTWSEPAASFQGCSLDDHIKDQQIVFDTTFCGDWAGAVWSTDATCSAKASTCNSYVQNNPNDFANAYWSINSLKVYQASEEAPITSFAQKSSSTSAIASSVSENVTVVPASTSSVSLNSSSSSAHVTFSSFGLATSTAVPISEVSGSNGVAAPALPASTSNAVVPHSSASPSSTTTAAPKPTTLAVSGPGQPVETLTALSFDQFPDPGETQSEGLKPGINLKRRNESQDEVPTKGKRHAHLMRHSKNIMIGHQKRVASF